MAKRLDVEQFHANYDVHKDHRLHLFGAIADFVASDSVLYPGSYVDIAPSVFFHKVHYVDTDRRADRFFGQREDVTQLVSSKRDQLGRPRGPFTWSFECTDYRQRLAVEEGSVDLLISLYAGFISESCTRYLAPGGHLFVNNSHGDASMASLNEANRLVAVVLSKDGGYRLSTANLGAYLAPKSGVSPTVSGLHQRGRGVAYTRQAYAYVFQSG